MSESPSYDTPPKGRQSTANSRRPYANEGDPGLKDFDSEFCRNYASIKFIDRDAPFQERMEFDVYRRETKMEKYQMLKNAAQKKIPSHQKDLAFQRLQKDSERRISQKEKTNELLTSEEKAKSSKKMTSKDIERQYEKFMEFEKAKNDVIEEKKKLQEFQKEIEICESTRPANKGNLII